jgi:phage shock protein A
LDLQDLTQQLQRCDDDTRARVALVEEQARLALQRHECDAMSWSNERASLQSQLALLQQESSVASATFKSTIDKLENQVIS